MHKITFFEITLFSIFALGIFIAIIKFVIPKIKQAMKSEADRKKEIKKTLHTLTEEFRQLKDKEIVFEEVDISDLLRAHQQNLESIHRSAEINLQNMISKENANLMREQSEKIKILVMNRLDHNKIFQDALSECAFKLSILIKSISEDSKKPAQNMLNNDQFPL